VTAIKSEHYEKMNGYSNAYWGWGGEDEDAYRRAVFAGITPFNAPIGIARYNEEQKYLEMN